ncbi:hypothetical protein JR316_0001464 [Psilocybe cubensis]|uniref:Uncharacterized protein n=2 Tax=Psilocybe cubensis TaxID=181762 RepID=A0A8H7Y6M9_PSICU|nr:hypothetical protein JR316_0001464 [Psilocybe cubensis]KAH9487389.1 hypothetical protein JR316_0001464 [Psilocybe cubensis]
MTKFFSGLDSPSESDASSIVRHEQSLHPIQVELLQLANAGKRSIVTKLGINNSSRIVLDIVNMAQNAKSHRNECSVVASEAYLLLSVVIGGVKGRAIDVNSILRDHIARLNEDLGEILQIIKGFASWWILLRTLKAPRGLDKCHNILHHSLDMYMLLLRCSLAQSTNSAKHSQKARRSVTLGPKATRSPPATTSQPLPKTARRSTYPVPRSVAPSTSRSPWSQPPNRVRRPVGAAV